MSVRGTVRRGNFLSGNYPFGELYVAEMCFQGIVHSGNCSRGNCQSENFLSGNVFGELFVGEKFGYRYLIITTIFSIMKTTFASEEPKNFVYRRYKTFSHENFKNKLMSKTVEENC